VPLTEFVNFNIFVPVLNFVIAAEYVPGYTLLFNLVNVDVIVIAHIGLSVT